MASVALLSLLLAADGAPHSGLPSQQDPPELRVGVIESKLVVDGRLDEEAWRNAPMSTLSTTIEPTEGGTPNARTEVRVLADAKSVYLGVRCFDDPDGIVSFAVARDASLDSEDHIKIVLGPYADGRTGYVFAVNPRGARYDALVAQRGESENASWNGAWEARTTIDENGWTLEMRVPVAILAFDGSAGRWQFNIERRVQRLLERSRWATPRLDQRITQLSRAGYLTGLPRFDLGLGLWVMPSAVVRNTRSDPAGTDTEFDGSLDGSLRITPELSAVFTLNTDFAEADVDRRQINLTRFPLFFPEQRPFFLEGADAFDFGLGLGNDVVPFLSRRIGLVEGQTVPLEAGGKLLGRIGKTSIGALIARTGAEEGVAPGSTMGVVRLRQDVLAESNVGLLATVGDPLGRDGSYTVGADATFQTSRLFGDRNFLVGLWGLAMGRDDLEGQPGAYGLKIDYPNDDWDIALTSWRIDEDFEPSLGFVPRPGVYRHRLGIDYGLRPSNGWLRRQVFESSVEVFTDLEHHLQSWNVFTAPLNMSLESGDGFEFNVIGNGDRPDQSFELADGVSIAPGEYEWLRYRAVVETASKRTLTGELSYEFGEFYDGRLQTWEGTLRAYLSPFVTVRAEAELNRGWVSAGSFSTELYGLGLDLTFSPDLTWTTFLQFDSESDTLGLNTRLRWDISPTARLFAVFNSDVADPAGAWETVSQGATAKFQYEWRF